MPANQAAVNKSIAVYSCPATQPNRSMTICDVNQNAAGTGIAGDYFGANGVHAWWFSDSATNTAYSENTETALADNRFKALVGNHRRPELHAADYGTGGTPRLVHPGRKAIDHECEQRPE